MSDLPDDSDDGATAGVADGGDERELSPLEELWWLFKDAGLPFPPLPRDLADRLREVDTWVFASREVEASPWDVDIFAAEAVEDDPPDYVLVAHTGYGVNSWAMHYFVVQGSLGIFLQVPWGGVYTDNEAAVARLKELFAAAGELIEAAADTLEPDERLVVVESARDGGRVARFPSGTPLAAVPWRRAPDPTLTALAALRPDGSGVPAS